MSFADAAMAISVPFSWGVGGWFVGCVTGYLIYRATEGRGFVPPPRRRVRIHRRRRYWVQREQDVMCPVALLPEAQTLELVK